MLLEMNLRGHPHLILPGERPVAPVISRVAPRRLSGWALLVCMTLSGLSCQQEPRCEPGLCPVGTRCEPSTGMCQDVPSDSATLPFLRGAFDAIAMPGLGVALVGYASQQNSLVWLERKAGETVTQYIAGPAAGGSAGPEGQLMAAQRGPDGVVWVTWIRSLDQTLWLARRVDNLWQAERVDAVPPKRVGASLALGVSPQRVLIAFEDTVSGGVSVATRNQGDTFTLEALPAPDQAPIEVRGQVSVAATDSGATVAYYDAVAGDLVLSTYGDAKGWQSARFAGHAADGHTDAGLPCALARDLSGGLVVAWRDRTRNVVKLARSQGGKVQVEVIADGKYAFARRKLTRRHIVGTSLDVAVLPSGKIAVALQDASRGRVTLAVEQLQGGFKRMTFASNGRAQLRPQLVAHVDGSIGVAWLELAPNGQGEGSPLITTANVLTRSP